MKYNHKIIETSSYVEIWSYEKPIGKDQEIFEPSKPRQIKRKIYEMTEDEQVYALKRALANRKNQYWQLIRLVDLNFDDNTKFLTLTVKKNMTDRKEFNKEFEKFMKRLNYHVFEQKKMKIKYIAVLERQKRGAWHAHIILFSFPYVEHKKLKDIWGLGAVRINKLNHLDDSSNAGRYVAKYMAKGIEQELYDSYGKKSFYKSRNLLEIEEIKFNGDINDFIETYEDLAEIILDGEIVYQSDYNHKIFRLKDDGLEIKNSQVDYLKIKKKVTNKN